VYLLFLQVMAEVRDFKQVNMTGYRRICDTELQKRPFQICGTVAGERVSLTTVTFLNSCSQDNWIPDSAALEDSRLLFYHKSLNFQFAVLLNFHVDIPLNFRIFVASFYPTH